MYSKNVLNIIIIFCSILDIYHSCHFVAQRTKYVYTEYFRHAVIFTKSAIISDNTDWPTGDISKASRARWQVENRFRPSKDDDLASTSPIQHWTDIFKYPAGIRRIIYTTNTIEAVRRQFRKSTKTKGAFPNQDSLLKLLHMTIQKASRKWTTPTQNWSLTISQVAIFFAGRLDKELEL